MNSTMSSKFLNEFFMCVSKYTKNEQEKILSLKSRFKMKVSTQN